jgi:hypothetical protein
VGGWLGIPLDKGGHCLNRRGMTVSHKGEREIRIQGSA